MKAELTVIEIAKILEWSHDKVTRWIKKRGIPYCGGGRRGAKITIAAIHIKALVPDAFDVIEAAMLVRRALEK
jgi:hypothetical protein